MSTGQITSTAIADPNILDLPTSYTVTQWYAVYTTANHEKRVAEQLALRGVEHFLPLYETASKWKDRRVILKRPLFPGYVFVRMALRDRLRTQQVPGVARLVGFGAAPSSLPDEDIEALREALAGGIRCQPHPFLEVGRRVRVKSGPLQGLEGTIVRSKNRTRLVISIALIQRAFSVEMATLELMPV